MDIVQAVIATLFGGGFVGFIEFLIHRSDEKKNKHNDLLEALERINQKIEGIVARMDKENADGARRNILSFDDELRRETPHSEESYNQVLQDIKDYRNFCRTHADYENDKATSAIDHIRETYQRVKSENKFI